VLGALGVVYGDIGTSPLYAIKECFHGAHPVEVTTSNVLGVLSLVIWTLLLIVTVKYLGFVMRADNRGEGGILALMTLVRTRAPGRAEAGAWWVVTLGLFGAALLYGDGIITPAISVLSAAEGISVANAAFEPFVIPFTVVVLVALFVLQSRGTAKVGALFGPVMVVWFVVIGLLGLVEVVQAPYVLQAVFPWHGARFLLSHGWSGFLVLGGVFLVATGSEALYADMGHFGRAPIRKAWFLFVLPGLLANYFGQGALLLTDPTIEQPFYSLAPRWALVPLIALSTVAAVIASQALISGAFSLTRQAVQLGFLPRMHIDHTSATEVGQIYIAPLNWALLVGCLAVVIGFGSSSAMAAAYGIAVATTMVITSVLLFGLAVRQWRWSPWLALPLFAAVMTIEVAFLLANATKIASGGWFPLVLGALIFALLTTWNTGRTLLSARLRELSVDWDVFDRLVAEDEPPRVPRSAVFMAANADRVPPALLRNYVHNRVLHERIVCMTVQTLEVPYADVSERVVCTPEQHGTWRVVVQYGFMEEPNVPRALAECRPHGLVLDLEDTTFFLGRETILPSARPGMTWWREVLFSFLTQNAQRATAFFKIPPALVVEIGSEIEI
jgi:KUP system potassium uptake protein